MVAIEYENILGPCIITAISSYQMAIFQKKVGRARKKYKVPPPATTGENVDVRFVRVFRAHQNCVETYAVFLGSLWSGSLLCHQAPSSVLGLVYIFARAKYFNDYSEAAEKRIFGFKIAVGSIAGLGFCSLIGVCLNVHKYFKG